MRRWIGIDWEWDDVESSGLESEHVCEPGIDYLYDVLFA